MSCNWPEGPVQQEHEGGEPEAPTSYLANPARKDAMAAMFDPPARVSVQSVTIPAQHRIPLILEMRGGERLTTTQVGLVTAASFRT